MDKRGRVEKQTVASDLPIAGKPMSYWKHLLSKLKPASLKPDPVQSVSILRIPPSKLRALLESIPLKDDPPDMLLARTRGLESIKLHLLHPDDASSFLLIFLANAPEETSKKFLAEFFFSHELFAPGAYVSICSELVRKAGPEAAYAVMKRLSALPVGIPPELLGDALACGHENVYAFALGKISSLPPDARSELILLYLSKQQAQFNNARSMQLINLIDDMAPEQQKAILLLAISKRNPDLSAAAAGSFPLLPVQDMAELICEALKTAASESYRLEPMLTNKAAASKAAALILFLPNNFQKHIYSSVMKLEGDSSDWVKYEVAKNMPPSATPKKQSWLRSHLGPLGWYAAELAAMAVGLFHGIISLHENPAFAFLDLEHEPGEIPGRPMADLMNSVPYLFKGKNEKGEIFHFILDGKYVEMLRDE